MKTIALVIYDNDGVNVNSEDLAMRVADDFLVKMVGELSTPLAPNHVYNNYAGTSTNKIVSQIMQGRSIDPADVIDLYNFSDKAISRLIEDNNLSGEAAQREAVALAVADLITLKTIEVFKKEMKAIPGVVEAHREIAQMVGPDWVFLATTSRGDRMDATIESAIDPKTGENAGLSSVFRQGFRRFSGYGSPNKYDAFFEKMRNTGTPLNIDAAVVIEDSTSGVKYAKAGRPNLRVVGTVAADFYPDKAGQSQKLMDAGAAVVVSDMHDLPKALRWLDEGLDPSKKPEFASKVYTPAVAGPTLTADRPFDMK